MTGRPPAARSPRFAPPHLVFRPPHLLFRLVALPTLAWAVSPAAAHAQAALYEAYQLEESAPRSRALTTPFWVRQLENETAIPRCGGNPLGRSALDGGLASRPRDPALPCRDVWQSTVRFELGGFGGGIAGQSGGGLGGVALSLGLRLHDLVSVYYLLTASGGAWANESEESRAFFTWNAFLFELSPAPRLGVAVGPSLDFVGVCGRGATDNVESCGSDLGYGVHTRVTIGLATLGSVGLTLTGDAHIGWRDERELALVGGLGLRF